MEKEEKASTVLTEVILPAYLEQTLSAKLGFVESLTSDLISPSVDPLLILFVPARRPQLCLFVCKMGIGALRSRHSSHLVFFHSFHAIKDIVDHSVAGRVGWSLNDNQNVWFELGTKFEAALFLSRVLSLHEIPTVTRPFPSIL